MVGGAPYANEFIASFRAAADPRIRFPGPIYGRGYRQLLSHALVYIHATEVGGTHPALVEAMGYGNCLVVNDTPENREVAGDTALYFRADSPATLAASTRCGCAPTPARSPAGAAPPPPARPSATTGRRSPTSTPACCAPRPELRRGETPGDPAGIG